MPGLCSRSSDESESDDGIDSDDEEDEYEHYEKLVTTRILAGIDLETLNKPPPSLLFMAATQSVAGRRRIAAKELARQLLQLHDTLQETDSVSKSEDSDIGVRRLRGLREIGRSTRYNWVSLVVFCQSRPLDGRHIGHKRQRRLRTSQGVRGCRTSAGTKSHARPSTPNQGQGSGRTVLGLTDGAHSNLRGR